MKFPFLLFRISGHSMEPLLCPRDLVIVWQWGKIRFGDVVVFKNGKEFWVKRVKGIESQILKVEGDNKSDSLEVGEIKIEKVLGKVVKLTYGRRKRGP